MPADSFGMLLRALRLGYHYVPRIDAFVRIDGGRDRAPFEVHACRTAADMKPGSSKDHCCFWDNDPNGDRMLDACPALARVTKFPIRLLVGEDGEEWPDEGRSQGRQGA